MPQEKDKLVRLELTPEAQRRLWEMYEIGRAGNSATDWEMALDEVIENVVKPK